MSDHETPTANHRTVNGIPFETVPWHEDLKEVARLYRWLEQIEEPPESVVDFLLNVESWQEQYSLMLIFCGGRSQ